MKCPTTFDLNSKIVAGDLSYLLPLTTEERGRLWKLLSYKDIKLPKQVSSGVIRLRIMFQYGSTYVENMDLVLLCWRGLFIYALSK